MDVYFVKTGGFHDSGMSGIFRLLPLLPAEESLHLMSMSQRPFAVKGRTITILLLLIMVAMPLPSELKAQNWVELQYAFENILDLPYRRATDFAGQERDLHMDVSLPIGDIPPLCGRPAVFIVHGGGWMAGGRSDAQIVWMRQRFAARGYVAISVQYRLGMFHTDAQRNCNIPGWNCWNIADSTEYERANYRAVQDVHAAIVFAKAQSEWQIDSGKIFLIGESAGAFVSLSLAYLDHPSEIPAAAAEQADAARPNRLYEPLCIQATGLAANVAEMQLQRPDLGSPGFDLESPESRGYRMVAMASIYGAAFDDYWVQNDPFAPDLWLYHQPCDLIVPFGAAPLLAGYNQCSQGFPANCASLTPRPQVFGSSSISQWIESKRSQGQILPRVQTFFTSNQASCLEQALNPQVVCHQMHDLTAIDLSMAQFFSDRVGICQIATREPWTESGLPKALTLTRGEQLELSIPAALAGSRLFIVDIAGRVLSVHSLQAGELILETEDLKPGLYFLQPKVKSAPFPGTRLLVMARD